MDQSISYKQLTQAPEGLHGHITVPGDKSISHRGVMLGALAEGTTRLTHFLNGADCMATVNAFRDMGVSISLDVASRTCTIQGAGLHGLKSPSKTLYCANSGTTVRLISGILAAQSFDTVLTGDASLSKRPMKRIMEPLNMMGADIQSEAANGCLPLHIHGRGLHGISYVSPVASAQVKSAILLAGLYADGETVVSEPAVSRDHSERMLRAFGAEVRSSGMTVSVSPCTRLHACDVDVPGDISSAAYFMCAAAVCPSSEIYIENVGINPTRDGVLRVLKAMGADIEMTNERSAGGEPVCDLVVRSSSLHGTVIEGDIIPTLIDEIPVLAVAGAFAEGDTLIRDASELRVKESDRISTVLAGLRSMGADVEELENGMIIHGGRQLHGAEIECAGDHRIAMSFAVAAMAAEGTTLLKGADCVNISYPSFFSDLESLGR